MSTIQTGRAHVARRTMPRKDRNALIVFFALAYGLSWAVWGSTIAQQGGLIDRAVPAQPFGFLAVTVAAVVATAVFGGRPALRAFGSRLVLWRVPVRWYVAAVVLPALPALAALGVHLGLGGQHDIHALVPLSGALPLLLTQLVLHLLTEEAGWRGVALPHLRAGLGSLPAAVVLGLLWAGWHIPMFFLDGVSISVVMTWVWDNTKGSVLIAALFHAAMNVAWAVLNVVWGDLRLFWLCVAFTAAIAVGVAVRQVRDAHMTSAQAPEVTTVRGAAAPAEPSHLRP
jgi:membrane protease YdiL (CAAX protease family)